MPALTPRRLLPFALLVALTACATPAPTSSKAAPEGLVNTTGSQVNMAGSVVGLVKAPVIAAGGGNVIAAGGGNVIAAGGGNVIAAGGGNVIAAGGLNYRIRQAASAQPLEELPVQGARVLVRDAKTLRVLRFVRPVVTDEHGRFTVPTLPPGMNVFVEVVGVGQDGTIFRLTSLLRSDTGNRQAQSVNMASTMVASHVVDAAGGSAGNGKIYVLGNSTLEHLTQAVTGALSQASSEDLTKMAESLRVRRAAGASDDVQLPEQYDPQAFQDSRQRVGAMAGQDAVLKSAVGEVADALKAPLTMDEQKVINQAAQVFQGNTASPNGQGSTTNEQPSSNTKPSTTPTPQSTATPTPTPTETPKEGGPVVTSLSQSKGSPSTLLLLTGKNFSAAITGNTVTIGGVKATVVKAAADKLQVEVPADAKTGNLVVEVAGKASAGTPFTVATANSVINSFDVGFPIEEMAVSPDGALWAVGTDGKALSRILPDGTIDKTISTGSKLSGLLIDRKGGIWTASDRAVLHCGADGVMIEQFATEPGPHHLALAPDGNVWVSNKQEGNVRKIVPGQTSTQSFPVAPFPVSLVVDGTGNVVVLSTESSASTGINSTLTWLIPADGTTHANPFAGLPQALACDASGNVWVTISARNLNDNHTVYMFPAGGIPLGSNKGKSFDVDKNPRGLTFDKQGNLWVAHGDAKQATKFDTTGKSLAKVSLGVAGQAVAVDGARNIWVSAPLSNKLIQIAP